MSNSTVQVHSILYSIDGQAQGTKDFQILPGAQQDLLVHDMQGWIHDSYGKVCSTITGGGDGDVDGRMVYYKALDLSRAPEYGPIVNMWALCFGLRLWTSVAERRGKRCNGAGREVNLGCGRTDSISARLAKQ